MTALEQHRSPSMAIMLLHKRRLHEAYHGGMGGFAAHHADGVGPVATIAQGLARPRPLDGAAHLTLDLARQDRQALDRAALMRIALQHAAGLGLEIIP